MKTADEKEHKTKQNYPGSKSEGSPSGITSAPLNCIKQTALGRRMGTDRLGQDRQPDRQRVGKVEKHFFFGFSAGLNRKHVHT